ncbi:MAG: hypothetical protein ACJAV6_000194 [Candidatus Paceibacteria bacterium]|jgi:hypothetical protein
MLTQAQSFLDNAVLRPVVLQIIDQARLMLEQYTVLELTDDYMFEDQDEFLALYTVRDLELSAVEGER